MVRQRFSSTASNGGRARTGAEVGATIEAFLAILESAGWGFCCVDLRTNTFIRTNAAFAAMHGYAPDELTGRPVTIIEAPEARAHFPKHIRIAEERGNCTYESLHRRKDGTTFPVAVSLTTVRSDTDELWFCVVCVWDISERKQAEEALRESEAKFRTLAEMLPAAIFIVNRGGVQYVNPAVAAISGYSREELQRLGFLEVIHPEFRSLAEERAEQYRRGESVPRRYELKIARKDGGERWIDFIAGAIEFDGAPALLGAAFDITERKRAEQAIRESEERYRTLVEHARDVIFELDDDRITYVSPSCEQVLGYRPEELVGTSALSLLGPKDRGRAQRLAWALAHTGAPARGVHRMRHKNGSWRWFESTGGRFRSQSGHHHGVVIARDITERMQQEEALRQSERRFAATFHASPLAIVIGRIDDQRFLDVNERFLEMTGYLRGEVIGRCVADLQLFEDPAEEEKAVAALTAQDPVQGLELRIRKKTGELRDIVTSITRIDLDGERCFLTMSADITERKRAEAALRESEERFRMLAEHANDMIYRYRLVEPQGFDYVSPSVTTIAGYTPEEYYADPDLPDKIIHPEDKERFDQSIRDRLVGPVELRWFRKDGSVMWAEQRNVFLYNEAGAVVAVQGIIRDITDRKLAEEALQRARDELEARVEERLADARDPYGLTFRELTVLHLVAQGKADKEIATELGISPHTVQKHLSRILSKMRAASRTEAGVRAVREGLLG